MAVAQMGTPWNAEGTKKNYFIVAKNVVNMWKNNVKVSISNTEKLTFEKSRVLPTILENLVIRGLISFVSTDNGAFITTFILILSVLKYADKYIHNIFFHNQ